MQYGMSSMTSVGMIHLTKRQRSALTELGEPGHYRVGWAPKLGAAGYRDLVAKGLIVEAWTFLSTTRPDVAITDLGVEVRKAG